MREKIARQIAGRDFDIVKEGLDEVQVEAFATEIISERDDLMRRHEHLNSLTKLQLANCFFAITFIFKDQFFHQSIALYCKGHCLRTKTIKGIKFL